MNDYNIWYSTVNLPFDLKLNLLKEYKTTENIWICSQQKLFDNKKISLKLKSSWDSVKIDAIKASMMKNQIDMITYNDVKYPVQLKNFDDSPCILFYKGNIGKLNNSKSVAIIGSRRCTIYGERVTKLISEELSKLDINIVSGMAYGIDTLSHKACIENHGYTCAILGSGLDIIYPRENTYLFKEITDTGCVISEYPPGTQPLSRNFPIRNRIISGLSDIIVVVEANYKSGSLITARLALEQGKDVVAVPGPIFSEQSKGTNLLLKDGAYVFTSAGDIVDLLGIEFEHCETIKVNALTAAERKIYNSISNKPIHIDDIIRITNIDINQLYEVLFELQLKNEIMCISGNYYVKAN